MRRLTMMAGALCVALMTSAAAIAQQPHDIFNTPEQDAALSAREEAHAGGRFIGDGWAPRWIGGPDEHLQAYGIT